MSRKHKNSIIKQSIDEECANCMRALYDCTQESNPATRAMLKEKLSASCSLCSFYHSLKDQMGNPR
jgi:hypothetical protein